MTTKVPHPARFFALILPFGIASGFVSVAFPFLARPQGLTVEQIGAVVALSYVPHAWKVLWAPLVDATLNRRTWYLAGAVLTVIGTFMMALAPPTSAGLNAMYVGVFVSGVGSSILGIALEGIMALCMPEEQKGRASGWFQAGNLFGNGVGGGAALWVAERFHNPILTGLAIGAVIAMCVVPITAFTEPVYERAHGFIPEVKNLAKDLWKLVATAGGFTGLVICLSPVGAGGASNLFSAIAVDFSVDADTVEWVNGAGNGIVAALGALAGGWLADRIRRRVAYAISGALMGAAALFLAFSPRTPVCFIVGTLAYNAFTGVSYAAFTGFVLEAIGRGEAVGTKYQAFASLANLATGYMTTLDSNAYEAAKTASGASAGVQALFVTETLWTAGGIAFILALVWFLGRWKPAAPPATA